MNLPVIDRPALYRARIARGLSRKALADASDVSRETIRRIELGPYVPHPKTVSAIASALGIDTLDLYTDEVAA